MEENKRKFGDVIAELNQGQHELADQLFKDANRLRFEADKMLVRANKQTELGWKALKELLPELNNCDAKYDSETGRVTFISSK